jgi:site-specific DNA-methyltransferase (adenine-specific)
MAEFDQFDLFGNDLPSSLRVEEAATRLGVSAATIRNWLKTDFLKSAGRGRVDFQSLVDIHSNTIGKAKLTHRANKSQKDSHDHVELKEHIIGHCRSRDRCLDQLSKEYEEALSDAYRNKEGVYYTPQDIVSDLLGGSILASQASTFCDPCCGSGNFILKALELGIRPENIYGYDIDPVAVELTKARIYNRTGFESPNIREIDFLEYAGKTPLTFDYIFTNPPWGKKIPRDRRLVLGTRYGAGNSIDTCALFLFACLRCLNTDGCLGLLLPEAFFNIASFEDARRMALSLSIVRLIDYGRIFPGLMTKAQAIIVENNSQDPNDHVECRNAKSAFSRKKKSFKSNPKAILNLNCDERDAEVVSYLFSLPHDTLEGQATWGIGIVTGNNSKFAKNRPHDGCIPVLKGSDITQYGPRDPSCFIPSDLTLYQQVAPVDIYLAKKKMIYKFISSKLLFVCDDKQRFVLNSANVVIPDESFPVSMELMAQLLSGDFMNWIFNRVFCTHKVLRKDIEKLPIYSHLLAGMAEYDEQAYLCGLSLVRQKNGTYRVKG